MSALRELSDTRQIPGEPRRRWFSSPELDLIVWMGDAGDPVGFQLCYDKLAAERALTWRAGRGFDHTAVDNGEGMPMKHKATPLLVADGVFDNRRVSGIFREASETVPPPIRRFVTDTLARYPDE